jgi:hypothetical protein
VIHRWLCLRALRLHACLVLVDGGCLLACWWQLHRALAGNALSWAYTFEWPGFAVLAGWGWWQLVHDTPEELHHRRLERRADKEEWQAAMRGEALPDRCAPAPDPSNLSGEVVARSGDDDPRGVTVHLAHRGNRDTAR